ncbi:MAG: Flagellar hook-length control protein FliK [Phycisphaerales bacterium]|nr:Flagellar hook-length control protein FliK [Phycisphaerales bacterium]
MRAMAEAMEPRLLLSAASLVADINLADLGSKPTGLTDVNGTLFFAADDGVHGRELWATDAGGGFPRLVGDLNPGPASSNPSSLAKLGSTLFFFADDPVNGHALWASGGTAATTRPLISLLPSATHLTAAGAKLFFVASKSTGDELWSSNGTAAGTALLAFLPSGTFESSASPLVALGSKIYFTDSTGSALWSSDGTAAGTMPVAVKLPNFRQTMDTHLTAIGNNLYFVNGPIWVSDGTAAGTIRLLNLQNGTPDCPTFFVPAGNSVVFPDVNYYDATQLYVTDGTLAGTHPLDLTPTGRWTDVQLLGSVNGRAIFGLSTYPLYALWSTDGTVAGSSQISDVQPYRTVDDLFAMPPLSIGGELYFGGFDTHGYELWKTDGTAPGTAMVKDIQPFESSYPTGFAASGDRVFFAADDGAHGSELWSTDGTTSGTGMVADLNLLPASSSPVSLTAVPGGRIIFGAQDAHGVQPWVSDGTPGGTYRVKDVNPLFSSTPRSFVTLDGFTYFVAADDGSPFAGTLWKTDGTDLGTVPVRSLTPEYGPYKIRDLTVVGDTVWFTAADPFDFRGARSLWKVVGHTAVITDNLLGDSYGPIMNFFDVGGALICELDGLLFTCDQSGLTGIHLISPPNLFFRQGFLKGAVVLNGILYFAVQQGTPNGVELWRTDATAAGTTMVARILTDAALASPRLTVIGGKLCFVAGDGPGTLALWSNDGTPGGTHLIHDLGITSVNPQNLTGAGSRLFFTLNTDTGNELWVSDGTDAGTHLAHDIQPGSGSSNPQLLTAAGDEVYFSADDGVHGRELWRSDGTDGGTLMVQDINPGPAASNPSNLTLSGGNLFFSANDGTHGTELWVTSVTGSVSGSVIGFAERGHSGRYFSQGLPGVIVFADTNGNGLLDPGEISTTTDASGHYTLAGLLPGHYAIQQLLPPGYEQASPGLPAIPVEVSPDQSLDGLVFSDLLIDPNGLGKWRRGFWAYLAG